jgi:hypothetical protein
MPTVESENVKEEKEGLTNIMTWLMIGFIALLMFLYYRNETLSNVRFRLEYPIWVVHTIVIGAFLISTRAWYWYAKLMSPSFHADNLHSSITGRKPIEYGGYKFVKLGCIDYMIVTEKFSDGTAIYPKTAHNQVGSNITANVRLHNLPVSDMTTVVRNGIALHNLKPPYYYGEISSAQYMKVLQLIKPGMTEAQKKEVYETLGKLDEADAGYMSERLKEESRMCSYHERDKNILQRDISTKVDLIARITEKPGKWQKIREKVFAKKEEAGNA